MVDDRVTDGKRIGQLLSSELSGRARGALGRVSVVDADPDAEPSADGTAAYGVAVDGDRIADAVLFPDATELVVRTGAGAVSGERVAERARDAGLVVDDDGDEIGVRIESGAAVKRAVDAFVAGIES